MWHISMGFLDAVTDRITKRSVVWLKTERFAGDTKAPEEKQREGAMRR